MAKTTSDSILGVIRKF